MLGNCQRLRAVSYLCQNRTVVSIALWNFLLSRVSDRQIASCDLLARKRTIIYPAAQRSIAALEKESEDPKAFASKPCIQNNHVPRHCHLQALLFVNGQLLSERPRFRTAMHSRLVWDLYSVIRIWSAPAHGGASTSELHIHIWFWWAPAHGGASATNFLSVFLRFCFCTFYFSDQALLSESWRISQYCFWFWER